uniref:F-box associated beta-propeller type 1 domain-containing protein n=1 Tax=Brassica oleracea var. oleracea TaxID=109376 RepID=A0A0D3CCF5_BRAOL
CSEEWSFVVDKARRGRSFDTKPLTGFPFHYSGESFFVDEEEEVAVVLDEARDEVGPITRSITCIIDRYGPFKQVDLGGLVDPSLNLPGCSSPLVFVCSYVPSSVEIM